MHSRGENKTKSPGGTLVNDYYRSLLVFKDNKVVRKLSLQEAQALYPDRNPLTLDRDLRRAAARLDSASKLSVVKPNDVIITPAQVQWAPSRLPLQKDRPTKFVALFDMHYPYNVCLRQITAFLEDFAPDVIIYGGDFLNMDPFSHWALKVPRTARELPLPKPYYEKANKELFLPLRDAAPGALIVAIFGNHELWVSRAIDDEPRAEGYWEVELNIDGVDQWVPQGGMVSLGKLYFIHGDQVSGSNVAPARNLLLKGYNRNIMAGHLHTYSVATQISPIDVEDRHIATYAPCLTTFNPPYMGDKPHQWVQGLVYGFVEPNGHFHQHVSIITHGKFEANGRLYE